MTQLCLQVSLPYAKMVAAASTVSASAVSASVIKHDEEEDGEDDECSDTNFSVTIPFETDDASSLSSLSSSSFSSSSSSSSSSSFSLLSMEDDEEEEDHDVRPTELRESYRDLYGGGGCRVGRIYPPSSPKDVRFFWEEEEEDSVTSYYDDFGGIYDCVDRGDGGTSLASSSSSDNDDNGGGGFRTYDRVLHTDRFSGSDHLNNKFHDRPCFGGNYSHGHKESISSLCHSGTEDTEFVRYDADTDTDVAGDTDTTTNDRSSSSYHHDHSLPTPDVETLRLQEREREQEQNKTNVSVLAYWCHDTRQLIKLLKKQMSDYVSHLENASESFDAWMKSKSILTGIRVSEDGLHAQEIQLCRFEPS